MEILFRSFSDEWENLETTFDWKGKHCISVYTLKVQSCLIEVEHNEFKPFTLPQLLNKKNLTLKKVRNIAIL